MVYGGSRRLLGVKHENIMMKNMISQQEAKLSELDEELAEHRAGALLLINCSGMEIDATSVKLTTQVDLAAALEAESTSRELDALYKTIQDLEHTLRTERGDRHEWQAGELQSLEEEWAARLQQKQEDHDAALDVAVAEHERMLGAQQAALEERLSATTASEIAQAEAHERAAAALEADSKVALEALAAEHSAVMVQLRNEAEEATAAAVETAVRENEAVLAEQHRIVTAEAMRKSSEQMSVMLEKQATDARNNAALAMESKVEEITAHHLAAATIQKQFRAAQAQKDLQLMANAHRAKLDSTEAALVAQHQKRAAEAMRTSSEQMSVMLERQVADAREQATLAMESKVGDVSAHHMAAATIQKQFRTAQAQKDLQLMANAHRAKLDSTEAALAAEHQKWAAEAMRTSSEQMSVMLERQVADAREHAAAAAMAMESKVGDIAAHHLAAATIQKQFRTAQAQKDLQLMVNAHRAKLDISVRNTEAALVAQHQKRAAEAMRTSSEQMSVMLEKQVTDAREHAATTLERELAEMSEQQTAAAKIQKQFHAAQAQKDLQLMAAAHRAKLDSAEAAIVAQHQKRAAEAMRTSSEQMSVMLEKQVADAREHAATTLERELAEMSEQQTAAAKIQKQFHAAQAQKDLQLMAAAHRAKLDSAEAALAAEHQKRAAEAMRTSSEQMSVMLERQVADAREHAASNLDAKVEEHRIEVEQFRAHQAEHERQRGQRETQAANARMEVASAKMEAQEHREKRAKAEGEASRLRASLAAAHVTQKESDKEMCRMVAAIAELGECRMEVEQLRVHQAEHERQRGRRETQAANARMEVASAKMEAQEHREKRAKAEAEARRSRDTLRRAAVEHEAAANKLRLLVAEKERMLQVQAAAFQEQMQAIEAATAAAAAAREQDEKLVQATEPESKPEPEQEQKQEKENVQVEEKVHRALAAQAAEHEEQLRDVMVQQAAAKQAAGQAQEALLQMQVAQTREKQAAAMRTNREAQRQDELLLLQKTHDEAQQALNTHSANLSAQRREWKVELNRGWETKLAAELAVKESLAAELGAEIAAREQIGAELSVEVAGRKTLLEEQEQLARENDRLRSKLQASAVEELRAALREESGAELAARVDELTAQQHESIAEHEKLLSASERLLSCTESKCYILEEELAKRDAEVAALRARHTASALELATAEAYHAADLVAQLAACTVLAADHGRVLRRSQTAHEKLVTSHAAQMAAFMEAHEEELAQVEAARRALSEQHGRQLMELTAGHEEELGMLTAERHQTQEQHHAKLAALEAKHAAALREEQRVGTAAQQRLAEEHEQLMARQAAAHKEALEATNASEAALAAECEAQLAQMLLENESKIDVLIAGGAAERRRQAEAHSDKLTATESHSRSLEEVLQQQQAEKVRFEALDASREEAHEAALARLHEQHKEDVRRADSEWSERLQNRDKHWEQKLRENSASVAEAEKVWASRHAMTQAELLEKEQRLAAAQEKIEEHGRASGRRGAEQRKLESATERLEAAETRESDLRGHITGLEEMLEETKTWWAAKCERQEEEARTAMNDEIQASAQVLDHRDKEWAKKVQELEELLEETKTYWADKSESSVKVPQTAMVAEKEQAQVAVAELAEALKRFEVSAVESREELRVEYEKLVAAECARVEEQLMLLGREAELAAHREQTAQARELRAKSERTRQVQQAKLRMHEVEQHKRAALSKASQALELKSASPALARSHEQDEEEAYTVAVASPSSAAHEQRRQRLEDRISQGLGRLSGGGNSSESREKTSVRGRERSGPGSSTRPRETTSGSRRGSVGTVGSEQRKANFAMLDDLLSPVGVPRRNEPRGSAPPERLKTLSLLNDEKIVKVDQYKRMALSTTHSEVVTTLGRDPDSAARSFLQKRKAHRDAAGELFGHVRHSLNDAPKDVMAVVDTSRQAREAHKTAVRKGMGQLVHTKARTARTFSQAKRYGSPRS
eukprot:SAG11_NODE_18_length_25850_cov_18.210050_2_plen_1967_part_00